MRLCLDVSGISFSFEIKDYSRKNRTEYGCTWCQADISLRSGDWLNFNKKDQEILTAEEVDDWSEELERLLNNQMQAPEKMGFIEPDLFMEFYPERCGERGSYMEWQIYFWSEDGWATDNYLSLDFERAELEALEVYLKLVQGSLSENDEAVQKLMQQEILR